MTTAITRLPTQPNAPQETDVVIVGAGPAGLFQVFELGLLGLRAEVIDTLAQPGGQCSELYPDKPIYDIPACPAIGAQELTDRLLEQIAPFGAGLHFNQQVTGLQRQDNQRFLVTTSAGQSFDAGAVVIAAGMGAFSPVKLRVADSDVLVDSSLFYRVKNRELHRGKHIAVVGGGDSALDWALDLQEIAASVTLIHRSQKFKAAPASVAQLRERCDRLEMQFVEGQISGLQTGADGLLQELKVTGTDQVTRRLEAEQLLVFFGLSPELGPIAEWGLDRIKNQIAVDTEKFQTSETGIYAVGDINVYPGKKRLILSGFHEAALAAFAIKSQLEPGKKVHLQYTTTSPIMHQRLQVEDPMKEADETDQAA